MRAAWAVNLKAQCAKVLVRSDGKEMALKAPGRQRVLRWLHAAWAGRSSTTVKGGFKHIGNLFNGCEITPSMPVQPDEVDDELVASWRACQGSILR